MRYYWKYEETHLCPECGQVKPGEKTTGKEVMKKIGTDQEGWYFRLHIYPEEGIHGLTDWLNIWLTHPKGTIVNVVGESIGIDEMIRIILHRWAYPRNTDITSRELLIYRATIGRFNLLQPLPAHYPEERRITHDQCCGPYVKVEDLAPQSSKEKLQENPED